MALGVGSIDVSSSFELLPADNYLGTVTVTEQKFLDGSKGHTLNILEYTVNVDGPSGPTSFTGSVLLSYWDKAKNAPYIVEKGKRTEKALFRSATFFLRGLGIVTPSSPVPVSQEPTNWQDIAAYMRVSPVFYLSGQYDKTGKDMLSFLGIDKPLEDVTQEDLFAARNSYTEEKVASGAWTFDEEENKRYDALTGEFIAMGFKNGVERWLTIPGEMRYPLAEVATVFFKDGAAAERFSLAVSNEVGFDSGASSVEF
jgi:hypothetical protein